MSTSLKEGDVFSTGSAHERNLRKIKILGFPSTKAGIARCLVAHGPNGKFYNSEEIVDIAIARLEKKHIYRRSKRLVNHD